MIFAAPQESAFFLYFGSIIASNERKVNLKFRHILSATVFNFLYRLKAEMLKFRSCFICISSLG